MLQSRNLFQLLDLPDVEPWSLGGTLGGLRDALSLFDQVLSFSDGNVSDEDLRALLGLIDRELLDLFQLHNASRWQVLLKLRLPSSVPYLVTGAKISSGMAVVGAIVGEFFTGFGATRYGLGYLIMQANTQTNTPELFAAVLASTALGICVFTSVNLAGATVLSRWYHA